MPLRKVATRGGDRDAVHCRDPVRTFLVVLDVRVKRLLRDLAHERRPARVPLLARERELRARETRRQAAETRDGHRIPCARSTSELLGLLPKLFEVHFDLLP